MIRKCDNCDVMFNDDTIPRCPFCFPVKVSPGLRRRRRKRQEKKDKERKLIGSVSGFINGEIRELRRGVSGARHRVKTGGCY